MSFRGWLSVVTLVLLALIVFGSRHEIAHAWHLLGSVNLWILALLIPAQVVGYFAAGEMMFSYLRSKKSIGHVSPVALARMSLEMNFVNHALPSGGVSGISYMTWRLGNYGVKPGRAATAQVVRYVMSFASFITLLLVAVMALVLDGNINRIVVFVSLAIVGFMVLGTLGIVFLVSNLERLRRFSDWASRKANRLVKKVTRGKRPEIVKPKTVRKFFEDMHDDFVELKQDARILIKPYLWGLLFNAVDAGLFVITFWAFGQDVNPAPVLIAYGLASIAGALLFTPGGAGAYEAIMVFFLTIAGIASDLAIAGIVLTRVVLLFGTIGLGYFFYQHSILKYGKNKKSKAST